MARAPRLFVPVLALGLVAACGGKKVEDTPPPAPEMTRAPATPPAPSPVAVDTVQAAPDTRGATLAERIHFALDRADLSPEARTTLAAKAEIMRTIRTMAAQGMAVVTVSSELEDLELLCDRVIVLSGGEVVGRIDDQREITVSAMLERAFRLEEEAA